jgi:hypothetical protein
MQLDKFILDFIVLRIDVDHVSEGLLKVIDDPEYYLQSLGLMQLCWVKCWPDIIKILKDGWIVTEHDYVDLAIAVATSEMGQQSMRAEMIIKAVELKSKEILQQWCDVEDVQMDVWVGTES